MKRICLSVVAVALLSGLLAAPLQAGAVPRRESREERDARMQGFRDAHFGVMICFGLYSRYGGVWKGETRNVNGCAEWMMLAARAPRMEYARAAKDFNPSGFDADAWIRAVRDAGAKYIVLITKHHEGFAIFKSKASSYNIVDATPFKRDVVKEVSAACRKYGIRLGIYYSQNLDWYHPGGGGGGWDPTHKGDPDTYVKTLVIPQIRELLTGYGKVDIFWYDIPNGVVSLENARKIDAMVHELQPGIIVNNRLHSGIPADIQTPEQFIPATGLPGADWETCMTMNRSWGFASRDHAWKDPRRILHMLCDVTSKGGNYLLNIGPDGKGVIPRPSLDRLVFVGKWLKTNGEAIYGTRATLFPQQPGWGRFTTRQGKDTSTLYALVFDPPADRHLLLPGLENEILSARILGSNTSLSFGRTAGGISAVNLDGKSAGARDFVVAIKVKGRAKVSEISCMNERGEAVLFPHAATCTHGMRMNPLSISGIGNHRESLGFWSDVRATASWEFQTLKEGEYALTLTLGAPDSSEGGVIEAVIDGVPHPITILSTGGWTRYRSFPAGTYKLSAGKHKLVLRAKTIKGQGACNVAPCKLTVVRR